MWNRLEGRPRSTEFDRSLRAEVRDPLWMLTRQWQFGEFKGEDAGSAVKARVQLNTSEIDRYAIRAENTDNAVPAFKQAVAYDPKLPLEVEVEREPVLPETRTELHTADLVLRSQMGRYWTTLLKEAGLGHLKSAFAGRFNFEDISEKLNPSQAEQLEIAHLQSDPHAWQTLQAVKGRLPDGRKLLAALNSVDFANFVDAEFDAALALTLKHLGQDFVNWFGRLYSQPQNVANEDAWAPSYLEYQFAVSAPEDSTGQTRTVLNAEQYYQGNLDWYAFDVERQAQLEDRPETQFPENSFTEHEPLAFLPTQIEFNGMPNVRFWKFEDRRTDFGSIRATTTDIPLLLLAEIGLIYGNDWTVIPYNLKVGSIADIKGVIVGDVFGVQTFIRSAGQGQRMDWQRWSMFNLASGEQFDQRLFLPPAVTTVVESDPIEKVIAARDEVANLVWGIETTIPGTSGTGVNGFEAGKALSEYFIAQQPVDPTVPTPNSARISYVLGNSVPENWIPFIATHEPGSNRQVRLQRGAMPRLTDQMSDSVVRPRGEILRAGLAQGQPYFLHEEEVPRAGVVVDRSFQRARGVNGEVFTWLGRRKRTGRGEGGSGLVFDRVVPVDQTKNSAPN